MSFALMFTPRLPLAPLELAPPPTWPEVQHVAASACKSQGMLRSQAKLGLLVRSLGQEDPLEKEVATHFLFLPGESHGQRSLVGYSPSGRKSWTRLSNQTTNLGREKEQILQRLQRLRPANEEAQGQWPSCGG